MRARVGRRQITGRLMDHLVTGFNSGKWESLGRFWLEQWCNPVCLSKGWLWMLDLRIGWARDKGRSRDTS